MMILASWLVTGEADELQDEDGQTQKNSLPPLPAARLSSNLPKAAADSFIPLTPDEIREYHRLVDEKKKARAEWPGVPPKPVTSTVTVDLSPGATPPVLRLSPFHSAVITFLDVTGAPWPIVAKSNTDKASFTVKEALESDPSNSALVVSTQCGYCVANIAVFLKGLPTAVSLTIAGGQRETDYRLDVRVPRRGPNAAPETLAQDSVPVFSGAMHSLLDGIEPPGVILLKVRGADARAWKVGEKLVLRTHLALLSPAYLSRMASSDGTAVYELEMSPVLLVSDNGSIRKITIDGI